MTSDIKMKDAIILFKFASRSRPQKFKEAMKSITDNLARPELVRYIFTFDENDPAKGEYNAVLDEIAKINYSATFGVSHSKIHACNRDLEESFTIFPEWQILVCMSDDMQFIAKGFDDVIRRGFEDNFPDSDGILHFPDQHHFSRCMTMSIIGRKYFERRNYIYHPEYISVECDLEAQEEAQMLGRYKYMGDEARILNHNHPSFGIGEYDAQYRKTEAFEVHEADKATRRLRKKGNYGLFKTETGWDTQPEKLQPFGFSYTAVHKLKYDPIQEKAIHILEKALEEIKAL